jgi:hypothetical protein
MPLRTPPIQQMKDVLHAIEVARSKESLRNGVVIRNKMTDRRWRVCFDLDHLDTYENQAQQKLAQQLQDVREGHREPVDPGTMACRLLDDLEFRPTAEECAKVALSLDAAHQYHCYLCKLTKDRGYNFFKNRNLGNWDDSQQLMYLADSNMFFLTFDTDFRKRIGDSPQSSQILFLPDLLKES